MILVRSGSGQGDKIVDSRTEAGIEVSQDGANRPDFGRVEIHLDDVLIGFRIIAGVQSIWHGFPKSGNLGL